MFDFITKISSIEELMEVAKSSSCPECGGVEWDGAKFIPGSCLFEDQLMSEEFNKQLLVLLNNINGGVTC